MKFRPCIDIHNGKVKQIIGSSLQDEGNVAAENFVAEHDADYFAKLFQKDNLRGGHIILLNKVGSEYYEATKRQAMLALQSWRGGMQIGGGITAENAKEWIDAGASHVIVTSYVFFDGKIDKERLAKLEACVGREHIVLDLSCSKKDGAFYIMTDRWQKYTKTPLDEKLMKELSRHCDEFLIHAIDVEGKGEGIDSELADLLTTLPDFPITYAGGVRSFADLELLRQKGHGRIDVTIGSALDIYGGTLSYEEVVNACK